MPKLTDRCISLREEVMNTRRYMPEYALHRAVYYPIGEAAARGQGLSEAEAVAMGVYTVAERFNPVIVPGEIIVGHNFGDGSMGEGFNPENTSTGREQMRLSGIGENDIEAYFLAREHAAPPFPDAGLTQNDKDAARERAAYGFLLTSNHSVLGYEKVLKRGFEGLLDDVNHWAERNGDTPEYRAMRLMCQAGLMIGEKYAEKAQKLCHQENSPYDARDLQAIISACHQVPSKPARTFREAVQALWFAHILNTWEDGINANSLGRLDQILFPYYQNDINKGLITRDEAFEIICLLWIKLYRDYDVQQSCVGGTNADGTSAVNELSYMMLDATEALGFVRCLSVRFSKDTDKAFLRRAMEVVGHLQKGVPFFFNDGVMIPSLEYKGIPHDDACGYTEIGCVETVIPGKSNPHAVTGQCNLLKGVELALNNGISMMYPDHHLGIETGAPETFENFNQFYDAVKVQVRHLLDMTCCMVRKHFDAEAEAVPRPYKALLTEGCMETGRDYNNAGAKYDYYQIMLNGVPNVADSLEAIRKFVYQDKKYTLSQVKEILENDFPDEAVRSEFIHKSPKYGNDNDEVDEIAADIIRFGCEVLDEMSDKYGLSYHAQPFTFLWMVDYGRESAASADGRHKGEILAYSVSPMQGRDYNGVTALFNSLCKLPTRMTPGTSSAIVEVDPKLFNDDNIDQLTEILLVSAEKGLSNVQFNTIDADTLIDAQKHPDKYNNLAVRVSGFSQKFNLLSPELQNHIIGRTKHLWM